MWLTDIAEHPTAEGKLYLCAVKDVWSNRIVGYSIDSRMKSRLAVQALDNAVANRAAHGMDVAGCVVHSDSKTVACLGAPGFRDSHADRPWGLPWCRRCSRSILTRTPIDPGKVSFPGHVGCSGAPLARPAVSPEPCD